MKKANLQALTYPLLFLFFIIASCNGQVKAPHENARENAPKTAAAIQTKIRKIPGINKAGNVHCGLQDKDGNMWFGTTGQGIYRYDGSSFTNFTVKDGLSSNIIYSILEDKTGIIWIGTDIGIVCRYDGKSFTPISLPSGDGQDLLPNALPTNNPRVKNPVNCIYQVKNGRLWFGTHKGVYQYNGKSFTRFPQKEVVANENNLRLEATYNILEDRNGNMWFSTWFEGLIRYNGKVITNFKPNNEVWFSGLLEDKNGNIWIGRRDKGVVRYDGKTFTNVVQHGILDSCGVDAMLQDKAGNIWISTEFGKITERETKGGLWRYDGKTFKNFTTKDGLPENAAFCLVEDKAGNLWVGTRGMGLCRFDGKKFTSFSE
ncbi:ligand-binding sensor domain-containing protein [Adhaeribacter terreus]|uniref:Two-component regulator propeller domain-containing protein n=1 Tax=Adhaeribacter terreus TaxID=529703 RepID=A0ABW0EDJ4_9BACT